MHVYEKISTFHWYITVLIYNGSLYILIYKLLPDFLKDISNSQHQKLWKKCMLRADRFSSFMERGPISLAELWPTFGSSQSARSLWSEIWPMIGSSELARCLTGFLNWCKNTCIGMCRTGRSHNDISRKLPISYRYNRGSANQIPSIRAAWDVS